MSLIRPPERLSVPIPDAATIQEALLLAKNAIRKRKASLDKTRTPTEQAMSMCAQARLVSRSNASLTYELWMARVENRSAMGL